MGAHGNFCQLLWRKQGSASVFNELANVAGLFYKGFLGSEEVLNTGDQTGLGCDQVLLDIVELLPLPFQGAHDVPDGVPVHERSIGGKRAFAPASGAPWGEQARLSSRTPQQVLVEVGKGRGDDFLRELFNCCLALLTSCSMLRLHAFGL